MLLPTALCMALAATQAPDAEDAPARRPNVLLIVADDQGWADFSFLGLKADVHTPRLDALAAEGVHLTQAYASSPICNPSRVGLCTGRYQQRWGNFYYSGGQGLPDASVTLAERLRTAGYATGYFGKVHTGGPDRAPDQPGFPLQHGFERFFGTTTGGREPYLQHSAAAVESFGDAARQMSVQPMWDDDQPVEWSGFTTEAFGAQARAFIEANRERPWFAQVAFNAVHNFAWQLPSEELEARGLAAFPDWDPAEQTYLEWYQGVHHRDWPAGRAYYLAQLECLDREVGRLLDALEASGQAEHTLVIYTVDNGGCVPDWADNGPLAGSKYALLEGGTRTRTLLRLPGVLPAGRTYTGVFSALDIAPSVCEWVGISSAAEDFDGRSQVAELCERRASDPERVLHWDVGWQWSVRAGRWKLLVTEDAQRARASCEFEQVEARLGVNLYDLESDLGETHNLAGEQPERVAQLRALHDAWRASIGN